MFDAVNSILDEFPPYAVELRASHEASRDAAAAAAAHFALVQLYPAQQAKLDALQKARQDMRNAMQELHSAMGGQ